MIEVPSIRTGVQQTPRRVSRFVVLLLAGVTALAGPGRAQEADVGIVGLYTLIVGEAKEFTLGEGDPDTPEGGGRMRYFQLNPTRAGLITLTAESLEGDAYIRVLDGIVQPHKVTLADDNGGIEWNPRLVIETVRGEPLYFDIGFKSLREGTLRVLAANGEEPLPQGDALLEARLEFFQAQEPLLLKESSKTKLADNLNRQTHLLHGLHEWEACRLASERLIQVGDELDLDQVRMLGEGWKGSSLHRMGEKTQAIAHLRRSVDLAVLIRSAPFELFAQAELGVALTHAGKLVDARRALDRALLIARAMGDDANAAAIYEDIGWLGKQFELRGAFSQALDIYEQARQSARELGHLGNESIALGRAGILHQSLGLSEEALAMCQEALVLGADEIGVSNQIQLELVMAEILRSMGRLDEAREALDGSLKHAGLSAASRERGLLLSSLTRLYRDTGDLELAAEGAQDHVALGRRIHDPAVEGMGLGNLGFITFLQGSPAQARELAEAGLALIRDTGSIDERVAVLTTCIHLALDEADTEAASLLLAEAEQLTSAVNAKGLGIEVSSIARSTNRWAMLGEYQQDLVSLQARKAEGHGSNLLAEDLDSGFIKLGQWRSRALLETMAQRRTQAVEAFESVTPGELLKTALPTGSTMIHYADGSENLYAYSITGGAVRWHDLGKRDEILELVNAFLDGVSRPGELASPTVVANSGSQVFRCLIKPVLDEALVESEGSKSVHQLIVVPTPSLAALPFEALVMSAPANPQGFDEIAFVLDHFEVTYAPSAPVLRLLSTLGPRDASRPSLVVADPVYTSSPSAVTPASARNLPELPGTRKEALAIARSIVMETDAARLDALGKQRSVRMKFEGVEIALGSEASAAALRRDLSHYSVLHFAAHGVIDQSDARLSGLAMSASEGDDGFLTVDDISRLNIDADLAVLSACDTARGEVRRGEGVQSIARAFLYAGARSVVASLWQVDDRETLRVMEAFYNARRDEQRSDSSALRVARLSVRLSAAGSEGFVGIGRGGSLGGSGKRRQLSGSDLAGHPYFWAPFVYVGLPR